MRRLGQTMNGKAPPFGLHDRNIERHRRLTSRRLAVGAPIPLGSPDVWFPPDRADWVVVDEGRGSKPLISAKMVSELGATRPPQATVESGGTVHHMVSVTVIGSTPGRFSHAVANGHS
jgi:hypothetical protein